MYNQYLDKFKCFKKCGDILINQGLFIVLCGSLLLSVFNLAYTSSQNNPTDFSYPMEANFFACAIGTMLTAFILTFLKEDESISFEPLT